MVDGDLIPGELEGHLQEGGVEVEVEVGVKQEVVVHMEEGDMEEGDMEEGFDNRLASPIIEIKTLVPTNAMFPIQVPNTQIEQTVQEGLIPMQLEIPVVRSESSMVKKVPKLTQ